MLICLKCKSALDLKKNLHASEKKKRSWAAECNGCRTCEGAALKKMRRSFQANRYPRMQQCSMLRGCTTANSPTCTLPKIFSTSSSVAVRILIIAAGGDLKIQRTVELFRIDFVQLLSVSTQPLGYLLINVLFSVLDCFKAYKLRCYLIFYIRISL